MTANIRHRARQQLQRYFSYNMLKLWFSSCSALAVCRQHIDWQRMSAVDGDRVQSGWCNPSMGNSCLRCWWAISQLDQIKMREEVKQSSRDTEKCPLQLLSVLLNLYFLIFDILGGFFSTLLLFMENSVVALFPILAHLSPNRHSTNTQR